MKRACSLNANMDEYFACEFHSLKTNYSRMKYELRIFVINIID